MTKEEERQTQKNRFINREKKEKETHKHKSRDRQKKERKTDRRKIGKVETNKTKNG